MTDNQIEDLLGWVRDGMSRCHEDDFAKRIRRVVVVAQLEEREACAVVAENMEPDDHGRLTVEDIAAAIRSRGGD